MGVGMLPVLYMNAVPADSSKAALEQVRTEGQHVSCEPIGVWSRHQLSLSTPPMVVGPPCT